MPLQRSPRSERDDRPVMGGAEAHSIHDIVDALFEGDESAAREVAAKDDEIDRLYHRVFDDLIREMSTASYASHENAEEEMLRGVTLMLVAHNLERIGDRVTNVAEDIVFLESGQVVELG